MKVKKKSTTAILRRQKLYYKNKISNARTSFSSVSNNEIVYDNYIFPTNKVCTDFLVEYAISELDDIRYYYDDDDELPNLFKHLNCEGDNYDINSNTVVDVAVPPQIETNVRGINYPEFNIILKDESIERMKKFDNLCADIKWYTCSNCGRSFSNLRVRNNVCLLCIKHPRRWTELNKMNPGIVPDELKCLTDIEAMLIAQVHPILSVHRHKGGQHIYSGNIISFPQNIDTFVEVLPHIPSSIPYTLIFHRKFNTGIFKCIARPTFLRNALVWLKHNNKWYKNIKISEDNLSLFPEDGDITSMLRRFELDYDENNDDIVEENSNSFVPDNVNINQDDIIHHKLNLAYPSLDKKPIDEFKKDGYISRAFPVLFPIGTADFSDYHDDDDFSFIEYSKFLMQYQDRRFAKDFRLRYFLLNTYFRHQLISKAKLYIKQGNWDNDNAEAFKKAVDENPKIMEGIVSFNKNLKSTTAFWKSKCRELSAMCKQLEVPSIFFTLSAADYHWPDLFKLIAPDREFSTLTDKERHDLMNDNPVLSSYFFQYRAELFIKTVIVPLFGITDSWCHIEWQSRGSPHMHGILWISDAPKLDENNYTDEELVSMANYFKSLVFEVYPNPYYGDTHPSQKKFSDIPVANYEQDLKDLIGHVQRHTTCSTHCMRRDNMTKKMKCRYNFPCETRNSPEINMNHGYLRFFAKRDDPLVQRYSNIILQSWRANHDFSPICSSTAVIYYVAKYVSKGETMSKAYTKFMKETCKNKVDINLRSLISSMFIKTLGDRDLSSQEICHLIMGWPLLHSSRSFVYLNLFDQNYDSLNIKGPKVKITKCGLTNQYRNRPKKLDKCDMNTLSLYNFAKDYKCRENRYSKHKISRIVLINPFIKKIPGDDLNIQYYWQQCLLHIPFRCDPQDLLKKYQVLNITSWKELYVHKNFNEFENNDYHDISDSDSEEVEVIDDGLRQTIAELNCGIGHSVTTDTIGRRILDLGHNWSESASNYPSFEEVQLFLEKYTHEPLVVPESENNRFNFSPEQTNILKLIDIQINNIVNNKTLDKNTMRQFIVQGKAGSGKSTLIHEIVRKVNERLPDDYIRVCAPTGAAAININGNTLHSEFNLPLNAENIEPLTGVKAKNFQTKMKNLKFLIIDEMSMIGAKRIWQLNCRLKELNSDNDEPFGGIYIFFFGDFRQLPPVKDVPLYSEFASSVNGNKGLKLFQSIPTKIELKSTYRQADDVQFAQLVERLGLGTLSQNDYKLLETRNFDLLSDDEKQNFETAVYLCSENKAVKEANEEHLENLGTPIAMINSFSRPNIKLRPCEEEGCGLASTIYLSVGCRVMLTKNLWTKAGLVNGALGTVTAIIYDEGVLPPELPLYILVKFDKYYGNTLINDSIPIVPINVYWNYDNRDFFRKQYPLILSYASSIHKGQGLTIPKVIINIGEREFATGLTYVAITRAKKLTDIIFRPFFSFKRIFNIGKSAMMKIRTDFIKSFSS